VAEGRVRAKDDRTTGQSGIPWAADMNTQRVNKPVWIMKILVGTLLLVILAPDYAHARLRTRVRPAFSRAWVRLMSARHYKPRRSPPKHAAGSVPDFGAALEARIARLIATSKTPAQD